MKSICVVAIYIICVLMLLSCLPGTYWVWVFVELDKHSDSVHTLEYMVIIQEINLIYSLATAVPFYIREVWQTWALNYLINYKYKSNSWPIIKVLRQKRKLFSYIIHFLQFKNFYTLREFSIAHCVGTIITNCTCVHILPLFCYNS